MQSTYQFVRLEEPSERSVRQNGMRAIRKRAILIGEKGAILIRKQETRSDGIHPYPLSELDGQFRTQIFGPIGHGRLGHPISGHASKRAKKAENDGVSVRKSSRGN